MIVAVRRALAVAALGAVLSFGAVVVSPAGAETPSPTPAASAASSGATASASAKPTDAAASTGDADTTDVAPDNSRQSVALGIAAAAALVAGLVVFARRR